LGWRRRRSLAFPQAACVFSDLCPAALIGFAFRYFWIVELNLVFLKTCWEAALALAFGAICALIVWGYWRSHDADHRRRIRWFAAGCTAGIAPTSAGGYIALADFNRDGKLDFATAGNLLAIGNGDGTFRTPVPIVSKVPYGGLTNIAAGDLNGDGWPDLVITSFMDSYIYVLINNQHGGFTATVIHAEIGRTLIGPTQVLLADLKRDGKLDMVVAGGGSGGAFVYIGDGSGTFTFKEQITAANDTNGVLAVSDVNGDGVPDLIMTEGSTVAIFLGKGDATFADPYYIGAGPSPGDLLTQNLHGQAPLAGLPDIVVPDASGGVMVLINTTK
jgi:hypothetical protein